MKMTLNEHEAKAIDMAETPRPLHLNDGRVIMRTGHVVYTISEAMSIYVVPVTGRIKPMKSHWRMQYQINNKRVTREELIDYSVKYDE